MWLMLIRGEKKQGPQGRPARFGYVEKVEEREKTSSKRSNSCAQVIEA